MGHGPAHGARVTCSLDMTVKVYTMQTGQMLFSVSFTSPITAVVMDNMETTVYAGTKSGQIHSFSLLSRPRDVCGTGDSLANLSTWAGHTGQVTGLALGMDGCTLASGGVDSMVHLWDTPSGQVVGSLQHKEGVTHVQFMATPPALLDHDRWSPGMKLVALQKGTNQKEFTCPVLNRTDMGEGDDWMRDEKVHGGSVGMEEQGRE